jgi:hypothetical protein
MAVTLGDDDGNSYSEGDNDIGSDNDGDHWQFWMGGGNNQPNVGLSDGI